jgi:hypothetical protein
VQQTNHIKQTNRGAAHLKTHDGHRCPALIPSGVNITNTEDKSLYKAFASSDHFRSLDDLHLRASLLQTLQFLYEDALTDAEGDLSPPDDIITILSDALDSASEQDSPTIEMSNKDLLYLLEYSKVYKIGGVSSPYVCFEWHGVQIPQSIISLLQDNSLTVPFLTDDGDKLFDYITFYERNPAGRGLDFTDNPADKEPFLRYAVILQCINPITDITKRPLPPLEDIAEGIEISLQDLFIRGSASRKQLEIATRAAGTYEDWFDEEKAEHIDIELNEHLGARGIMSPGTIQDPEGARTLVASFCTAAGAAAAIVKRKFSLFCYQDLNTGRLRLDRTLTAGGRNAGRPEQKTLLLYNSFPHPMSSFTHSKIDS